LRWDCPGDIGYACTNALGAANAPWYGVPSRAPPCTLQSDRVFWIVQGFFYGLPSICFALTFFVAMRTPITKEVERQLQEQLARASAGETRVFNPITFEQIMRHRRGSRKHMIDNLRGSAAFNSFSEEEQALILLGKSGQDWLRWLLQVRTVGLALLMVLVWAILSDAGHFLVSSIHSRKKRIAFKYTTLMLGCVMAMCMAWVLLKLFTYMNEYEAIKQYANLIAMEEAMLLSCNKKTPKCRVEPEAAQRLQRTCIQWVRRVRIRLDKKRRHDSEKMGAPRQRARANSIRADTAAGEQPNSDNQISLEAAERRRRRKSRGAHSPRGLDAIASRRKRPSFLSMTSERDPSPDGSRTESPVLRQGWKTRVPGSSTSPSSVRPNFKRTPFAAPFSTKSSHGLRVAVQRGRRASGGLIA